MFERDEAKRLSNLSKHRLDVLDAAALFDGRPRIDGPAIFRGDARVFTVAVLGGLVVTLIWIWRGQARRLISFRRARDAEKRAYRQLCAGRDDRDG
ncbi:BrnT family toxin [Methylobacterium sp. J-030]|uniref:BrnT family toxin n=1 Tax=Methylobacterium sp. J-030 TaxID=2836627 RepID=UPI001FBB9AF1|nr:BrnT family toxin [Methylobacterium sp. J-030]MCJ2073549.1 BrnT family toxin [Methylobacterium sp. J-030]